MTTNSSRRALCAARTVSHFRWAPASRAGTATRGGSFPSKPGPLPAVTIAATRRLAPIKPVRENAVCFLLAKSPSTMALSPVISGAGGAAHHLSIN